MAQMMAWNTAFAVDDHSRHNVGDASRASVAMHAETRPEDQEDPECGGQLEDTLNSVSHNRTSVGDQSTTRNSRPSFAALRSSVAATSVVVARSVRPVARRVPKVLWLLLFSLATFGVLLAGVLPTYFASKAAFDDSEKPTALPANLTEDNALLFTGELARVAWRCPR